MTNILLQPVRDVIDRVPEDRWVLRPLESFTVAQIMEMTEAQLLRQPNFGRKRLEALEGVLAKLGLVRSVPLPRRNSKPRAQVVEGAISVSVFAWIDGYFAANNYEGVPKFVRRALIAAMEGK